MSTMKLVALVSAALVVVAALGDRKSLRELAQDSQAQHSAETDAAQGSLVEAHAGKALAGKAMQSSGGHGSPLLRSAAHDVAGLATAVAAASDDLCSVESESCLYFEWDKETTQLSGSVGIKDITGYCNPYNTPVIQYVPGKNFIAFVGKLPSPDVCSDGLDGGGVWSIDDYECDWMDMRRSFEYHDHACESCGSGFLDQCHWFDCFLDITFVMTVPGNPNPWVTKHSLRVAKSRKSWYLGGDECSRPDCDRTGDVYNSLECSGQNTGVVTKLKFSRLECHPYDFWGVGGYCSPNKVTVTII